MMENENHDAEWIYNQWDRIDERVNKVEQDIAQAEQLAEKLLVDIEFLRIMFEEDLV